MPRIYVPTLDASEPRDMDIMPLCVPKWIVPQIISYLETLSETPLFTGSEEDKINAMYDTEEALALAMSSDGGCAGVVPELADEYCNEYEANSFIIEYAPNDPFQTPDLAPDPYQSPPWVRVTELGEFFPNLNEGDAIVTLASVPIDYLDWLSNPLSLIQSGLPRLRINMQGEGNVELHLLQIPQGGLAVITIDSNPLTTRLVNMASIGIAELGAWITTVINTLLDVLPDGFESEVDGADLVNVNILEIPIEGEGSHHIDIVFIPNINDDVVFGFGGGIRKVVLCRNTITGVDNQMPQFQVNPTTFQMEWKPNELTESWAAIGQVIHPVHMQVDNNTIQYTLQPIPIGGGADPFQQWLDLTEIINGADGADGDSPELRIDSGWIQWKLTASGTWNNLIELSALEGATGAAGSDGDSPELRIDSGWIQWKLTASGTWNNLIELSTLQGADGECDCEPSIPYSGFTDDIKYCNIATGLVDWLEYKLLQVYDIIDLAANPTIAANGMLDVLPSAINGAQLFDFIDTVNSISGAVLTELEGLPYDDMKSWLFCNLTGTGLDADTWASFRTHSSSLITDTDAEAIWHEFLILIGYAAADSIARIESYNATENDCSEYCADPMWCWQWDFVDFQHSWENMYTNAPETYGTWVETQGWNTQYAGSFTSLLIKKTSMPSFTLESIECHFTGNHPSGLALHSDVSSGFQPSGESVSLSADSEIVWKWTGSLSIVDSIGLEFYRAGNFPATLTKIVLSGTGTNPFGDDNC